MCVCVSAAFERAILWCCACVCACMHAWVSMGVCMHVSCMCMSLTRVHDCDDDLCCLDAADHCSHHALIQLAALLLHDAWGTSSSRTSRMSRTAGREGKAHTAQPASTQPAQAAAPQQHTVSTGAAHKPHLMSMQAAAPSTDHIKHVVNRPAGQHCSINTPGGTARPGRTLA